MVPLFTIFKGFTCEKALRVFVFILGQGMQTRKNIPVLQRLVTTLLLALN